MRDRTALTTGSWNSRSDAFLSTSKRVKWGSLPFRPRLPRPKTTFYGQGPSARSAYSKYADGRKVSNAKEFAGRLRAEIVRTHV